MTQYFLHFKYHTYDSDSYETRTYKMEFSSPEELKDFYDGFKKLPREDEGFYLQGSYVTIDVFKAYCIGKRNHEVGIDTGGVSTDNVYAFEVNTEEISLK